MAKDRVGPPDFVRALKERLDSFDEALSVPGAEYAELARAYLRMEERFSKVLAISDKYQSGALRAEARLRRAEDAGGAKSSVPGASPVADQLLRRLRERVDEGIALGDSSLKDVGLLLRRYEKLVARSDKIVTISDSYQAQLRDLLSRVDEMAHTDVLTGLLNRRAMLDKLEIESARAERYGGVFSIVLFDVDEFKQVNDGFGHDGGDEVLKRIAGAFESSIRKSDACARWGGEEFLFLYTETSLEDAVAGAEKCREDIEGLRIQLADRSIGVTVSGGVSAFSGGTETSALLKSADDALYRAKLAGKNRIES